jgi:thiamine-phosphate pyrophosphorylase
MPQLRDEGECGHEKNMPPECRLYLITPPSIDDLDAFAATLKATLDAGDVAAVQLRLKGAPDEAIVSAVEKLTPIARARDVALILNDRPDLAGRLDCDGVHIGQQDGAFAVARKLVGDDRIVGVTCHNSRDLAMEASEAGADYVAFGAFFPSSTKATATMAQLETLSIWQESMLVPCAAIGGITVANARVVSAAGADFLAVSSGVWSHPDGPAAAVVALNAEISEGLRARG